MTDLVPDGYWDRLETMLTACTKVEEPEHDIDIDFFNQGAIMTDREMLELAAKAAGYEFGYVNDKPKIKEDRNFGSCGTWGCTKHQLYEWNPLDEDSDALRLAVKLELDVGINSPNAVCIDIARDDWIIEQKNNDPYAATRRAIVRAAAAIGKSIVEQS